MPNWGQTIFQSANEINANTQFRKRIEEIQAQTQAEKEWWEKRRASIQSDFMKELDEEGAAAKPVVSKTGSDEDAVIVEANGVADKSGGGGKGKKKGKK